MEKLAPTQKAIEDLKNGKRWEEITVPGGFGSLGTFLMNQICAKGISIGAASELAGLNRATLYKILNGDTHPTRNVLLRLSRVLEMNIEKTQQLLKMAGLSSLSGSKTEDLIVMYGIINGMSIMDIDQDLTRNGYPGLFSK